MLKVCHLTSVHNWNDTRIFYKECLSLSKAGITVFLIVPLAGNFSNENIEIIPVSVPKNRLSRITITCLKILLKAVGTKAEIYHLHDPELLWVGIVLKLSGKKVIFDVHENIRSQIKMKKWLPLRRLISKLFFIFDYLISNIFYLVLAEKSYEKIYKQFGAKFVTVQNMPDIEKLLPFYKEDRGNLPNGILYVGSITEDRGVCIVLQALYQLHQLNVDFIFHCIGNINENLKKKIESESIYKELEHKIKFYGPLPIYEAYKIADNCKVGVSILKPIENYIHSYSTKIFEYMSIGLPVVASNFELYEKIITQHKTGICVNPLAPNDVANAINFIFSNKQKAAEMGKNGNIISRNEFNWKNEEKKLIDFYKNI